MFLDTSNVLRGPRRRMCVASGLIVASVVLSHSKLQSNDKPLPPPVDRMVTFEQDVRPILEKRCFECHGPTRQRGGLRLDSGDAIRKGGTTGVVIVAGKSAESLLICHVGAVGDTKRMPPKGDPLSKDQIAILRAWIDQGAKIPIAVAPAAGADKGWAFTPLKSNAIPAVPNEHGKWVRNPVDAFVLQKLLANGLTPSPEADRRTLIRRLTIDLTGLAPTSDEIDAFQNDLSPQAYERLVDRLLASPRYGERWARHWLDVVHYADSHGHDEDGPRPNAWPYRDYLIRSFNDDKPYARFVKEQVAGDVLYPNDPQALIATGFLAAGPWDQSGLAGIREDTLDRLVAYYLDRDDMVTTTLSTFSGLTVGCARCHDHKFDPITQEDYYSLQAVFAGIQKADRTFDSNPEIGKKRVQLQQSLADARAEKGKVLPALLGGDRQAEANTFEAEWRKAEKPWVTPDIVSVSSQHGAALKPLLDRSILSLGTRPDKDTYTITLATDLTAMTGLRLEVLSDETLPKQGPGRSDNGNLHLSEVRVRVKEKGKLGPGTLVKLKAATADFNQKDWEIARAIDADPETAWGIHPAVGQSHRAIFEFDKLIGFEAGTDLTIELDQLHGRGHLIGRFRIAVTNTAAPHHAVSPILPTPIAELLAVSPSRRTDSQKAALAQYAREKRLEQELAALPPPSRVYSGMKLSSKEGGSTLPPRIVHMLHRGDATKPGAIANAGSVAALPGLPGRFKLTDANDEGQRRAALADWLTYADNALTWRVIVNRIWHYHFGKGIVDTPNDFGKMGGTPSHPELLDWLAVTFRNGGSLKSLHRLIVTSSTYRQSVKHDPSSTAKDGDNRLLWRMNRTRMDAETLRDSVLLLSGRLDETRYGPPVPHFLSQPGVHITPEADYDRFDLDAPASRRRSIYRYHFRTRPDPLLEALDCPDASQSAPARATSVGALQALALWNNKFTLRHAEHLANLAVKSTDRESEQIGFVVRQIFGRSPTVTERAEWTRYVQKHGLANFCRVLFNCSEFLFVD